MLCVVISAPTVGLATSLIAGNLSYADIIELRLDHLKEIDIAELSQLKATFQIPMIFTLRSTSQGGIYKHSEVERLEQILKLAELNPDFFDLEYNISPGFLVNFSSRFPQIKLILSYHDFNSTPKDLEKIYRTMKRVPATYYKIAVTSNSCIDALHLLCWSKTANRDLIPIGMGSPGQITRILAPIVGSPITYACADGEPPVAPGQLSITELIEKFHHKELNRETALYGLIGDPIDGSIGDITHNKYFEEHNINAVYVKISVKTDELEQFLPLATSLGFKGLSVTMPLKEEVIGHLSSIDPEAASIGAVNTLVISGDRIHGYNTDGVGALNPIENHWPVKGKRALVIGAGGASKAIVYEACKRGAHVTILNRDLARAKRIGNKYGCEAFPLSMLRECVKSGYDILINCTPEDPMINVCDIDSGTLLMDIRNLPTLPPWLLKAKQADCSIVQGYEMFIEQAKGQTALWFKH